MGTAYFHMVPTVAAITILSKFQNDVKTSENKVVTFCHEQVGKVVVRFDTYDALLDRLKLPDAGQDMEINAGVGAFSKATKKPTITIDGSMFLPEIMVLANYKMPSGGIGNHMFRLH